MQLRFLNKHEQNILISLISTGNVLPDRVWMDRQFCLLERYQPSGYSGEQLGQSDIGHWASRLGNCIQARE